MRLLSVLTVESVASYLAPWSNLPIDFTRLQSVPNNTFRLAMLRCDRGSRVSSGPFQGKYLDIKWLTCVRRRGGPRVRQPGDRAVNPASARPQRPARSSTPRPRLRPG